MRALIVLLAAPAIACADEWTGPDKQKHFAVSFAAGVIASGLTDEKWKAVGIALLPGLIKEVHDSRQPGNQFSGKDMVWNALGAYAGVHTGHWFIARTKDQTSIFYRSEF